MNSRSSSASAAAYGIAPIITSILVAIICHGGTAGRSRPPLALSHCSSCWKAAFASNLSKVADGGWFPLLFGSAVFLPLMTWKKGSSLVARQRSAMTLSVQGIAASVLQGIPRVLQQ